ncbi:MAG: serine hydrolase, partial [Bacteroidota bacterium]
TILALPTSELTQKSQKIKNVILHARSENSILTIFKQAQFEGQAWEALPAVGASIEAPLSDLGQSLAAQTIFGGFDKTGLEGGKKRLGYAPPEALGLDGKLLKDSIQAIIQQGLDEGAFPGAQVLVAYKGSIIYHEAFGYHTYDKKKATQLDDIYDLASVTKVSSSLPYLMKRHGQGKFDLEASLGDYFPDFKRSNKGDIIFRQILAHNARLRPWIPYWKGTLKKHPKYPWSKKWDNERINDYQFRKKTFSRDSSADYNIYVADDLWQHRDYQQKMMKGIKKSPLNDKPGYVYSGLLFYLLPEYVARTSGKPYAEALDYYFYKPLGAHTLGFNPLKEFPKGRIIPTERDTFFRMTQIHGHVHDEGAAMMGGLSSNAGLFSSANDLAKLFQMYLNGGEYGGERYIAAESVKEFTRCQYCEEDNRRGLGFDKPLIEYNEASSSVAEAASPASFGHSGYTGTFAWADPEAELLFIFMSNRVYPTRLNRKLYSLGIRPRIHTAIYQALNNKK